MAELEGLYSDDEIQAMTEFAGFVRWRIGILEDGDWIFYIAATRPVKKTKVSNV